MPKTKSPKKEAVLAIGLDKPTADIVATAKAGGVSVSRTYVDLLKQSEGAGAKKASGAKKTKAAKGTKVPKAAAKPGPKAEAAKAPAPKAAPAAKTPATKAPAATPSKKEFVLGFGEKGTAADIVAAAKKAGMTLSANYVYLVRGRAKGPKPAAKRGPGRPRAAATPRAAANGGADGSSERRFVQIATELGLVRVYELLERIVGQARALA